MTACAPRPWSSSSSRDRPVDNERVAARRTQVVRRRSGRTDVALRFVDAIEGAVGKISRSPQSGSLRGSYELGIPGLCVRPLARVPYLVVYVVGDEVVDVWRVLHTRRDIPPVMGDEIGT